MFSPARRKGKRGGYRYMHLYLADRAHIHLLFLLDKGEQEGLSTEQRELSARLLGFVQARLLRSVCSTGLAPILFT